MEKKRARKRGGAEQVSAAGDGGRNFLALHRARCRICRHPSREEIEREFVDWTSPREMAKTWKIASYRAIYRHAHAVGLFERRRANLQGALERIIERVSEVSVTASAVVSAIRLIMQMERERREEAERRQPSPRFRLSLEGLPRTDAVDDGKGLAARVSGDAAHPGARDQAKGDGARASEKSADTLRAAAGAPTADGRPSGSPLQATAGQERDTADAGAAGQRQEADPSRQTASGLPRVVAKATAGRKGAETGCEQTASQEVSAAPDPRIALGEDGRVAGLAWPWPKEKITFARVGRRWRGRGGLGSQ